MSNKHKCKLCDHPAMSKDDLIDHIDQEHRQEIPDGWSAGRLAFKMIHNKDHGTCVVCKGPTDWNEKRCKYQRLCNNPNCKKTLREIALKNHIKVYNKPTLLNDMDHQDKMLKGRRISGNYTFRDGGKIGYVGSFEKKFLEFMDQVLECDSEDIMEPGPTLEYQYNNQTHKWITDFLYIPYNLIIEVKDGGTNPNNRSMPETREKTQCKDEMITNLGKYNYLKLTNNNFNQLLSIFAELKQQMIDDTQDNQKVIIRINEEVMLEWFDDKGIDIFKKVKNKLMKDKRFPELSKKLGKDLDKTIMSTIRVLKNYGLDAWEYVSLYIMLVYVAEIELLISYIMKSFEIPANVLGQAINFIHKKMTNKQRKPHIIPVRTNHLPKHYKMLCANTHFVTGLVGSGFIATFAGLIYAFKGYSFFYVWKEVFKFCIILALIDQWDARDFMIVDSTLGEDHKTFGTNKDTEALCYDTDIVACNDGVVIGVFETGMRDTKLGKKSALMLGAGGNYIVIMHEAGLYSSYCHLQTGTIKVKVGDIVKQGQVLAKMGNTGNSTTPHAHFEMTYTSNLSPVLNIGIPLTNFNFKSHDMSMKDVYVDWDKYTKHRQGKSEYTTKHNARIPNMCFIKEI